MPEDGRGHGHPADRSHEHVRGDEHGHAHGHGVRDAGERLSEDDRVWRASHDVRAADSAGRPWKGRSLSPQPFAGDDGTTPPEYAAALAAFQDGQGESEAVVDALRGARLMVPLLAELGEEGLSESGRVVDKQADLSIVTVAGPDGRRVLPVFSSVEALQRWRPEARPVPVEAVRAAVAAVDDDTQLLVVDPGSPGEFGLRRPAVWALAKGETWRVPWREPRALEAIARGLAEVEGLREVDIRPGARPGSLEGPELVIVVVVDGMAEPARLALAESLRASWARDAELVELVDSMAVSVVAAPERPETTRAAAEAERGNARQTASGDAPGDSPRTRRWKAPWSRGGAGA
ncbi:hypothetical protein USB125703_02113 [Pseudoclavibacter triregionum]|nr:hypothetical protein USB125703_02113 [Pseudoclavibacter triregionum]